MTKAKKILIWCLAAALLILGGSLPVLAALTADRLEQNTIRYRDMDSLELIFAGSDTLSPAAKLALLQSNVGEEQRNIEEMDEAGENLTEKLLPWFYAQLDSYIAMGLLPYDAYEAELITADAHLLYLPQKPEVNATMWNLSFSVKGAGQISAVVDNTGLLLALEFNGDSDDTENKKPAAEPVLPYDEQLNYAAEQYFSSLGLDAEPVDSQNLMDGTTKTFSVVSEYGVAYIIFDMRQNYFGIYPG